jgi:hypothetical protein
MTPLLGDARLERWIERELTQGLSPRRRARLHEQLRRDPRARARYDRAVEALRVLEGDLDVAPSELDVVGRWLADGWDAPPPAAASEGVRRWWPVVTALVAAALVLSWVGPLADPEALRPWSGDGGWQARGLGQADGLALEALCGPDEADDAARHVRVRDCGLGDLLGLAYRVPADTHGQLTVFGVDAQGDAMFYLPTPIAAEGATVDPGRWRALSLAVRLSVNHAPGSLRIYGLVAPTVATVQEVRALAAALAPMSPAEPGDAPWTARVAADAAAQQALSRLCPAPFRCDAAELRLTLAPRARP